MIFFYITLAVFVFFIVNYLFAFIRFGRERKAKNKEIVAPSKIAFGVGAIDGILFSFFAFLAFGDETWVSVAFLGFVWLGIIILNLGLGTVVIYDQDIFTVGWFPWQKNTFYYSDLSSFKREPQGAVLYCGKKKVVLNYVLHDCVLFETYALKRYTVIHGRYLERNTSIPKWDIFKGNLESAEGFIFIFGLMLFVLFSMTVWMFYRAVDEVKADETVQMEFQVDSYYIEDSQLILRTNTQNAVFELWDYKNHETSIQLIFDEIEEKEALYFDVVPLSSEKDEPFRYKIYGIEDNAGKKLLLLEEVNDVDDREDWIVALVCLFFFIVWGIYCIISVIVARNPQKFSRRVKNLLFRDGYLKG